MFDALIEQMVKDRLEVDATNRNLPKPVSGSSFGGWLSAGAQRARPSLALRFEEMLTNPDPETSRHAWYLLKDEEFIESLSARRLASAADQLRQAMKLPEADRQQILQEAKQKYAVAKADSDPSAKS